MSIIRNIGSGACPSARSEIESSHRYIPQKAERPRRGFLGVRTHQARLKIPGATWHPQTINPMLALRVLRANDWWSDFWQTYTCSEKPLMA